MAGWKIFLIVFAVLLALALTAVVIFLIVRRGKKVTHQKKRYLDTAECMNDLEKPVVSKEKRSSQMSKSKTPADE